MTPADSLSPSATLADVGEFGLVAALTAAVPPGGARLRGARRRRRRRPHPEGPRGGLHRPARRGPALPPRVGPGARDRPQGGRLQPLRRQRDGRHGPLPDRRHRRAQGPPGPLGAGPRRRHRRGGGARRRQHRRRRPDHRRPGGHLDHRDGHLRARARTPLRRPAPATSSPSPAARAGPPPDSPSWPAASAPRAPSSRPTSARGRRTTPDCSPPAPAPPR